MSYKVDKMLPTSIAAIAADNEHWVPYCEKAYAKSGFQIDLGLLLSLTRWII